MRGSPLYMVRIKFSFYGGFDPDRLYPVLSIPVLCRFVPISFYLPKRNALLLH